VQFKWSGCVAHYYTMLAVIRLNLLVYSTEILLFLPCSIRKVLSLKRSHLMTRTSEHQFGERFLVKCLAIFSFVHSEVYRITVSLGLDRIQSLTKQNMPKHKHPFLALLKWASFYRVAEPNGAQVSALISDVFSFSCRLPKKELVLTLSTGQNLVLLPHRLAFVI